MPQSDLKLMKLRWFSMIDRCTNPRNSCFERYGARGITVCDRWRHSFDAFLADLGFFPSRAHSIERIDNAGAYDPANCRWATRIEQGQNKRNNVLLTHQGKTQSLNAWAREIGVPRCRITMRLRRGWTHSEALNHHPWERRPAYQAGQGAVQRGPAVSKGQKRVRSIQSP